ncbi:MAG: hypothetical protein AAGF48_13010 [Pseudomonadota bacterium]
MAKTRLLASAKGALHSFAREHVTAPAEKKALTAAYRKVVRLLTPFIAKKFPPEDMALLDKYDMARRDDCIQCVHESGRVLQFKFEDGEGPLLPDRYCSSRRFVPSTKCMDAIDDWILKKDAHEKALKEIRDKYYALIEASRNVEDVLEVWPAAKVVLAPYMHQLPVAVSEATIAFIRKNNAGAELEAA